MAEHLTVYEVGDRFATVGRDGNTHVYEVAWDGRAYVSGYVPDEPSPARAACGCDLSVGPNAVHVLDHMNGGEVNTHG